MMIYSHSYPLMNGKPQIIKMVSYLGMLLPSKEFFAEDAVSESENWTNAYASSNKC